MPYDRQALVQELREMSFLENYAFSKGGDEMQSLLSTFNQFALHVSATSNNWTFGQERLPDVVRCPIPDVCIDERRLPLFIARATLRELIAGLEVRATGEAAR